MMIKRSMTKRRALVLAAIGCMLVGSACYAATGVISYYGSSQSKPECTDYDTLDKCTDQLGYEVRVPEVLIGEYVFREATTGSFEAKDGDRTIVKGKTLSVDYRDRNGSIVTLDTKPVVTQDAKEGDADVTVVDGTAVQVSRFTSKYVPEDYELTKEDRQRVAAGGFSVNYGSDAVEEISYVSAEFEIGNVNYVILSEQEDMTDETILGMATDVIRAK